MQFQPAGEILENAPTRTVTICDDPNLPDGEYTFIDLYCTDKKCDCRKTIFQIYLNGDFVSTVDFGWETPKYYSKWMKSGSIDEMAKEMSGFSIDFMSPNRVSKEGMLDLMKHLMDEKWLTTIKEHYRQVRASQLNNTIEFPAKIQRNAACPCGSNKKYKHCCLN